MGSHEFLPQAPVTVDLAGLGIVAVVGEPDQRAEFVRALLLELCAFHAPDDLRVMAWFPEETERNGAG